MSNEGGAGKGDANRVRNRKRFSKNYDEINWSNNKEDKMSRMSKIRMSKKEEKELKKISRISDKEWLSNIKKEYESLDKIERLNKLFQ